MRPIDLIIIGLVVIAFAFAVRKLFKDKKAGKSCASGCSGCSYASKCGEIERN